MVNVRPGPKGPVDESPVPLVRFPRARAKRVAKFAKTYLRVPSGEGVRKPFVLLRWQTDLLDGLYADGIRQGLVVMGRANGKSTLAAVMAVYDLFTTESAQVVVVASDQRQASIILNTARRLIETSPELLKRSRLLKDRIEVPGMGSEMVALPSDVGALQGWNPSLCVVDELHYVTREVWEAVTGFAGKRPQSLTFAISTPSDQHDSIMKTLVDIGRAGDDPSFYFREFTSDSTHPIDCEHCWSSANPALDDFLSRDGMRSVMRTMREPAFRRYRLAQWVSPLTAWLTTDQWSACADAQRAVRNREEVVLFFDGSVSDDSTALVGCTIANPHLFVIKVWSRPERESEDWRVDRADVDRTIDAAFKRYAVREMACDPHGWRDAIQKWARRYGRQRVIEFPTHVHGRMGPATDRLTEAVIEQLVTHDANTELATHVANCHVRESRYGVLVTKDRQKSPRKIDAAVCAIGAFDRAAFHRETKRKGRGLTVVRTSA